MCFAVDKGQKKKFWFSCKVVCDTDLPSITRIISTCMEDLEGAGNDPPITHAALTAALLPHAGLAAGADALPLGVSLAPLAPLPERLVLRRDALRCEQCGGYIGPHCDAFHGSWRCGLCGAENRSPLRPPSHSIRRLVPRLGGGNLRVGVDSSQI